MSSAVIFQVQSALILGLIYFGIFKRKNISLHPKIMKTAIIWDILLILQIEFTRGAINKASKAVTNPIILNIHVGLALASVILYGLLWYTGSKIQSGDRSKQSLHKTFGLLAATTRTLTFITSFFTVS